MFEFKKNAIQGALSDPLCAEYRREWQSIGNDKKRLVGFVMRQQSCPFFAHYCHNHKGLSKSYLSKEFKDYINGYTIHNADGVDGYTYGLYVDYNYDNDLIVDKNVIHVMWTVGASVVIPKTKCPIIYVSNKSDLHLVCEGYNNVKIYLFDKSNVEIDDIDADSNIVVYKFSDMCSVMQGKYCLGKVSEFRKEIRL